MNKKIIALLIGATIISSNNAIAAGTNVSTSKVATAQREVSQQINVSVLNQTGADIKFIRVVNDQDTIILNLNNSSCQINAECSFSLNRKFTGSSVYVKVFDKNNKLLGVAKISPVSLSTNIITTYADNFNTGVYVYGKLHKINSGIDLQSLGSAFATPLSTSYPFELLGAYFLDKIATNNYDENKVINRLAVKLVSSNPLIEASATSPRLKLAEQKISATSLRASANGQRLGSSSGYCGKGAQIGMKYGLAAAEKIPFLGGLFKLWGSINDDVCAELDFGII